MCLYIGMFHSLNVFIMNKDTRVHTTIAERFFAAPVRAGGSCLGGDYTLTYYRVRHGIRSAYDSSGIVAWTVALHLTCVCHITSLVIQAMVC